jgi:hypothetical protein
MFRCPETGYVALRLTEPVDRCTAHIAYRNVSRAAWMVSVQLGKGRLDSSCGRIRTYCNCGKKHQNKNPCQKNCFCHFLIALGVERTAVTIIICGERSSGKYDKKYLDK